MPRQRRRSRRGIQGRLAKQAENSKLLRLLLASVWFRLAVVGMFFVFVALVLALIPFLDTSPKEIPEAHRVSGLNMVQAWRLHRNAVATTEAKEYEEADYFWRAALRKNPGDVALVRGALENAMAAESQSLEWMLHCIGYANHFLRVAGTNDVTVALVADFYEKRDLMGLVMELLQPRMERLEGRQQQILLKAFFRQRRLVEFRDLWESMDVVTQSHEESRMLNAAYVAGWGKVEESLEALGYLRGVGAAEGENALLAIQLLVAVYGQNRDAEQYQMALDRLRGAGKDQHFQHAGLWVLLSESNRPNVARHQAEAYWMNLIRKPVSSAMELALVARAYDRIGLPEKAIDLFESFGEEYTLSPDYWAAYGTVLVNQSNWSELKVLALKIRNEAFSSRVIRAYSYYLEGLAEAGEGRTYNAGKAFDSVIEAEANLSADQAIGMAWEVYGIGYPEIAEKLLSVHGADLERNVRYWEITFASAYKQKRADLILEASERMMALDETSLVSKNNLAAALLVRRERPQEAIGFTLELISRDPTQSGFILNHGLALLQNGRIEEAERHFRALSGHELRPEVATSLGFGWFELYIGLRELENAERALMDVNESHLFPEQAQWLKKAKRELGLGVAGPVVEATEE